MEQHTVIFYTFTFLFQANQDLKRVSQDALHTGPCVSTLFFTWRRAFVDGKASCKRYTLITACISRNTYVLEQVHKIYE